MSDLTLTGLRPNVLRPRFRVEALQGSALPAGHPRKPSAPVWADIGGYADGLEALLTAERLTATDAPGKYRVRDTATGEILQGRGA